MGWYVKVLRNYFNFSGRAQRAEYWWFLLFNIVIAIGLRLVDNAIGTTYAHGRQGILHTIYALAVFIPAFAVSVRRLHDIGKSGWHVLVALIPCIGGFILLYWHCLDSESGTNAYGPNPKSM